MEARQGLVAKSSSCKEVLEARASRSASAPGSCTPVSHRESRRSAHAGLPDGLHSMARARAIAPSSATWLRDRERVVKVEFWRSPDARDTTPAEVSRLPASADFKKAGVWGPGREGAQGGGGGLS
jgi:hypothetical protein